MQTVGQAALVMWWRIDSGHVAEFEQWHSQEHFPERLAIPGFLRGTRWKAALGAARYIVIYETQDLATLDSAAYTERLNHPPARSGAVFLRFRDMMRSPCVVQAGFDNGVGGAAVTVRLSPAEGQAGPLALWLTQSLLPQLAAQPGVVAASLLQAQAPRLAGRTIEQKLRGGDASADWVLLVRGYDATVLAAISAQMFSDARLRDHGASPGALTDAFQLSHAHASFAV